jgi:hypothetical protein
MELWFPPGDRQRNSPKYVEFHFMNKFERLVHLVGFIIKNIYMFQTNNCSSSGGNFCTRIMQYFIMYLWVSNHIMLATRHT